MSFSKLSDSIWLGKRLCEHLLINIIRNCVTSIEASSKTATADEILVTRRRALVWVQ
jgi:hypothetical protein